VRISGAGGSEAGDAARPGAGAEKTATKAANAAKPTRNEHILFKDFLPTFRVNELRDLGVCPA
jgi:hypothetical protein